MDIAVIGTSAPIDPIYHKLDSDLSVLQKEGVRIEVEKVPLRDYTVLRFFVTDAKDSRLSGDLRALSKQCIANALADIIIDQLEDKIVWHIVKSQYHSFSETDQAKVFALATRLLNSDAQSALSGYTYRAMRRNRILYRLLEYLEESETLILEGFINFRLRSYLDELQQVVEQAVQELLLEKEQQEFVLLLQYFVDIQQPREKRVEVLFDENGGFDLQRNEESIFEEYVDDFLLSLVNKTISYDDLLVSVLITIAPHEIVIHSVNIDGHRDVVKTIEGIFEEKVSICTSCSKCRS